MVRLRCPRCDAVLEGEPGATATCPGCGFSAIVPTPPGAAAPPPQHQAPPAAMPPAPAQPYAPVPAGAMYGTPIKPYGGFWIRVIAYIIDVLVLFIPNLIIISLVVSGGLVAYVDPEAPYTPQHALAQVLVVLLAWLYSALLESSKPQATLGKLAVGLKVTTLEGRRISFLRATGRYFAQWLSTLILLIGFFMIGWTKHKQGLHDKLAGTLVYKKAFVSQQAPPPGPGQPWEPGPA